MTTAVPAGGRSCPARILTRAPQSRAYQLAAVLEADPVALKNDDRAPCCDRFPKHARVRSVECSGTLGPFSPSTPSRRTRTAQAAPSTTTTAARPHDALETVADEMYSDADCRAQREDWNADRAQCMRVGVVRAAGTIEANAPSTTNAQNGSHRRRTSTATTPPTARKTPTMSNCPPLPCTCCCGSRSPYTAHCQRLPGLDDVAGQRSRRSRRSSSPSAR